jgi:peptide deformylase
MALLKVARLGHPILVRPAEPVAAAELASPDVQRLIDDMIETMRDAPGVGLAAPQVHRPLRLFVMDPGKLAGRDEGGGLRVVVNPALTPAGDDRIELWEGCLSIPGLRGATERFAAVDLAYVDREGRASRVLLRGFPAAVAQHEADHLDGILFLRRMPDLSRLAFEDELERQARGEAEEDAGEDEGSPPDRRRG